MGGPQLTFEQQLALIERFLAGDPMAELELVSELRPLLRRDMRMNWSGLWPYMQDLRQEAFAVLWAKRKTPEGRAEIRPPLEELAKRLLEFPARKLLREKKPLPLGDWDAPRDGNQEAAYELHRLLAISANLPRGMSETILAHVAHLTGEGPELHEALGIDRNAARMRLCRAQAAVMRIAGGAEVEVSDE